MTRCKAKVAILKNGGPRIGYTWAHYTCVKQEGHDNRHKSKDDLSALRVGLQGPVFWEGDFSREFETEDGTPRAVVVGGVQGESR